MGAEKKHKLIVLNALMALGFIAVVVLSLFVGPTSLGVSDVALSLIGHGGEATDIIIYDIRLPRTLLAILLGASLGMGGAALQGLFQNPLAEPGVIGITASAGLGAVVALYFGLAGAFSLALPLFAFGGALIATFLLLKLALKDASVLALILTGIAINALAGALTALALNLSPNPYALNDIWLWLMGSVANRSMNEVIMVTPFVFVGAVLLFMARRGLDAMVLGRDVVKSLGVSLPKLFRRVVLGSSLAVGAAVSATGAVGFVGLVVPHLLRPVFGHEPSRLMLPSAIGGAIMVILADILVRVLPGGQELRLGVVTALVGAPFFLHLIASTRKGMR